MTFRRAHARTTTKEIDMKRSKAAFAAVLFAGVLAASPTALAASPRDRESTTSPPDEQGTPDHRFEGFLDRYEAANTAFVNGDPEPWLALATTNDPASIFGGFGGLGEVGVTEVLERYHLAARAFRPSGARVQFDYLVRAVEGRLAYTVAIERADVLYTGHTQLTEQVLRVTMIFRYERGRWRITHRHADDMIALELPIPAGARSVGEIPQGAPASATGPE
jgi:hypothetical protein